MRLVVLPKKGGLVCCHNSVRSFALVSGVRRLELKGDDVGGS